MLPHIITELALTMGEHLPTTSQWKESQMCHSTTLGSSSTSFHHLRTIRLWDLMLIILRLTWTTRFISNSRRTLATLGRTRNSWKLLVVVLYHLYLSLRIGSKGFQIKIRRILTSITRSLHPAGLQILIKGWCTLSSSQRPMLTSIKRIQALDQWVICIGLQCTILDQEAVWTLVYKVDQWAVGLRWQITNNSVINQQIQLQ